MEEHQRVKCGKYLVEGCTIPMTDFKLKEHTSSSKWCSAMHIVS